VKVEIPSVENIFVFYPEDGGDTFVRIIGNYRLYDVTTHKNTIGVCFLQFYRFHLPGMFVGLVGCGREM
jgi:hypothetical protein